MSVADLCVEWRGASPAPFDIGTKPCKRGSAPDVVVLGLPGPLTSTAVSAAAAKATETSRHARDTEADLVLWGRLAGIGAIVAGACDGGADPTRVTVLGAHLEQRAQQLLAARWDVPVYALSHIAVVGPPGPGVDVIGEWARLAETPAPGVAPRVDRALTHQLSGPAAEGPGVVAVGLRRHLDALVSGSSWICMGVASTGDLGAPEGCYPLMPMAVRDGQITCPVDDDPNQPGVRDALDDAFAAVVEQRHRVLTGGWLGRRYTAGRVNSGT